MVPGLARPALVALLVIGFTLAGCGDDDASTATDDDPASESGDDAPADDYVGPGGAGDSGDSDDDVEDGTLGPNEVAIQDFEFVLQSVAAGAEVSFGNLDGASHTLTAENGEFDTGEVVSGDSVTFTAPAAGDYAVFCVIHPEITATLTVE